MSLAIKSTNRLLKATLAEEVQRILPVYTFPKLVPVVDTSAMGAGDTLFDVTEIPNAFVLDGGCGELVSVHLLDKADNTAAVITLVFFDARVTTFGTVNAAPGISDADMLNCLGVVAFASGDFTDVGASKIGTKLNIGLGVRALNGKSLYVAAFAAGTPTEGAASDIQLQFMIKQGQAA